LREENPGGLPWESTYKELEKKLGEGGTIGKREIHRVQKKDGTRTLRRKERFTLENHQKNQQR